MSWDHIDRPFCYYFAILQMFELYIEFNTGRLRAGVGVLEHIPAYPDSNPDASGHLSGDLIVL